MSLLDTLTGGKSSEANEDLERALAAIQAVNVPTAESMEYKVQQLVQTGQITPEQAKTFLQSPNAMASMNVDQTGTDAQQQAIAQMLADAKAGGLDPNEEAQMAQIISKLNTQEKGANDSVLQNQAARGALTGGETLAAQLQGNQNATANANSNAQATAAQAYEQMLQELTSAGTMGANLQGQQNTQANTVGAATNAINAFNATQQQNTENENVASKNAAQRENTETGQNLEEQNVANANDYSRYQAQLQQEVEQDQLQKAAAEAGVSENQAANATTQGGEMAGLIGGVVGSAGEAGAAALGKPPVAAAHGGMIHDYLNGGPVMADKPGEHAAMAGDHRANDKIPAELSENEIVLPRSVSIPAMHGDTDKVMSFLNRIRSGNKPSPHPDDVATVLHALGKVRGSSAA